MLTRQRDVGKSTHVCSTKIGGALESCGLCQGGHGGARLQRIKEIIVI